MKELTSNGYDYYKLKKCWEPIEAALIVSGLDPESLSYNALPESIRKLHEKSVVDFKAGKLAYDTEVKTFEKNKAKLFLDHCSVFCRENNYINSISLTCFNPYLYVEWVSEHTNTKVPPKLMIDYDAGYQWYYDPDWKFNAPNSVVSIHNPQTFPPAIVSEVTEERFSLPPEIEFYEQRIYEKMKKLDLWTVNEGIALLSDPRYLDIAQIEFEKEVLDDLDLRPLTRAIEAGTLKVNGFNREKKFRYNDDFLQLKVCPFRFLEFVKEKEWFEIPPDLEFTKQVSEFGEVKYFWDSEINDEKKKVNSSQLEKNHNLNLNLSESLRRSSMGIIKNNSELKKWIKIYRDKERSDEKFHDVYFKFKKQLPYLGKKMTASSLMSIRGLRNSAPLIKKLPDYNFFKKRVFNTEKDCVSILIGVFDLDFIFFESSLESMSNNLNLPESSNSKKNNADNYFDYFSWEPSIVREPYNSDFIDEYYPLWAMEYILLEIKEMIVNGISAKKIDAINSSESERSSIFELLFFDSLSLDSFKFLKWAKENFYPIPAELGFKIKDNIFHYVIDDGENNAMPENEHSRSFVLNGDFWNVIYDGETTILNDKKPIRYILEVLKNQNKTIPYYRLKDIVSGSNKTNDTNQDYSKMSKESIAKEGLALQVDTIDNGTGLEESNEDFNKVFKAFEKEYYKLSNGTAKDKEKLEKGIEYLKQTYKRDIYVDNERLKFGAVQKKEYDNSRSLIGKAKTTVLQDLKTNLPALYRHLKAHLKMENGLSYNPPENSPIWSIID